MTYKHTQVGYLIIFAILVAISIFGVVLVQGGSNLFVLIAMFLILFLIASFASLKVTIDGDYLSIKFGYGIFKKRFMLNEIRAVKTVRNRWYYGWGIRVWFWPRMWIYNVSGFDAIELKMKNGKTYRVGTDEPKKLEAAVKRMIKVD